jgi:tetratricopeptide (TPR) repeat protein
MRTTVLFFTTAILSGAAILLNNDKPSMKDSYKERTIVYCAPSFDPGQMNDGNAPLLDGLGKWNYQVSTSSEKAARYFNQGLALMYGFNHGEAGRSFKTAIRLDSTLAIAYWGVAMVLGPNYNASLNPTSLVDINAAIDKAIEYSRQAQPHEKALINAVAKRFPRAEVKDMVPYYEAYAAAMKQAHEDFPDDAEIATLYADALMNMHPWDLWLKDGTAQPWTPAIISVLEGTLAKYPDHPGSMHYYIHATEASREAGKATVYADKLVNAMPAAGHIVHMPAHTYIRTGEYHKGVLVTEAASEADSSYIAQCKVQGAYPLVYYPHNIHFLAACAFLEGNSKKAMDAAWMVSRKADNHFFLQFPGIEHFSIIPYYMLVQLGKWKEIMQLPSPPDSLLYSRAIWHYARGMAFSAKGEGSRAEKELAAIEKISTNESLKNQRMWEMNTVSDVVHIALYTLRGEILAAGKQYDQGIAALQRAVATEDQLMYMEPPDWFFSVRLTLGHWLVQARRFQEAEKVYRQDLVTFPENGWALKGLYNSLKGQRKSKEAKAVKLRFDKAWQWADVRLSSSRVY